MKFFLCYCVVLLCGSLPGQSPCSERLKQGWLYLSQDAHLQAMQTADDVLAQCPEDGYAHLLKGKTLAGMVRHEPAITALLQANERLKEIPSSDSLRIVALYQAAQSCMRTSQYTKGIAALDEALVLQKKISGEYTNAYVKILNLYTNLAINAPDINPDPILAYTEKCIRNIPSADPEILKAFYVSQGIIYTDKGCALPENNRERLILFEKADSAFQHALRVPANDPKLLRHLQGGTWFSIGEGYQLRNRNDLAEQAFRTSMDFLKDAEGRYKETYLWSYTTLVRTMCPQGKYKECLDMGQELLRTIHYEPGQLQKCAHVQLATGVIEHQLKALKALCEQEQTPERYEQAVQLCREALELVDYRIAKTERSQLKYRLVGIAADIYDVVSNILFLNHSAAALQLLFEISERNKSYLLNSAQVERQAMQFANVPALLVQTESDLRKSIAQKEKDLAQEYLKSMDFDEKKQNLYKELAGQYHRYDSLKTEIQQKYPDFFNLIINKKLIEIPEVQAGLRSGQSMVEYFLTREYVYVFILNKDRYSVQRIPNSAALKTDIKAFHLNIYRPYTAPAHDDLYQECADAYTQSAYHLYQQLIEPFRDQLAPELIIVPDGLLNFVAFEALLTAAPTRSTRFASHPYLIRDYTMHYAYSATLLKENQQKKAVSTGLPFLGVAPAFPPDNQKQGALSPRQNLRPLTHNRQEVLDIQAIMGGTVVLDDKATKGAFIDMAEQYKVIHLATHAESMDHIGDYSFLAFTPVKESDSLRLFSKEIYNLSLQANMVVLSACQTGVGALKRGEGVISLARAFMYAGAKSVVTTLWSVDDAKTRELMRSFYLELQHGQTKDHALRNAKLQYLGAYSGESAHPFYWAAFIALGDMVPLRE